MRPTVSMFSSANLNSLVIILYCKKIVVGTTRGDRYSRIIRTREICLEINTNSPTAGKSFKKK